MLTSRSALRLLDGLEKAYLEPSVRWNFLCGRHRPPSRIAASDCGPWRKPWEMRARQEASPIGGDRKESFAPYGARGHRRGSTHGSRRGPQSYGPTGLPADPSQGALVEGETQVSAYRAPLFRPLGAHGRLAQRSASRSIDACPCQRRRVSPSASQPAGFGAGSAARRSRNQRVS